MATVETGESAEKELALADGRFVMSRTRAVRDPDGAIVGAVEITLDITRLKRAEAELRTSEQKLRAIFESMGEGVVLIDLETNILAVNAALVRLAHAECSAQLLGRKGLSFVVERDRPAVENIMVRAIAAGQSATVNCCMLQLDGKEHDVEMLATLLRGEQAQPIGVIIVVRDVAESRRLEAELRNAQKLEAVGLLAGGIAHDFNNILTAILGNISLARLSAGDGGEVVDDLVSAERACLRARVLTQQLLTFSRGGAPIRQSASIAEMIRDTATFALRGSKSRGALDIPAELWPADVDVGQISQVIQNLVINADQAMPAGGVVEVLAENLVATSRQAPALRPGARYIHVAVHDQGIGIAQEIRLNIFDPYFTTKESGRGLGLATSYSIVRQHDGYIAFESEVGAGTTFHIYLPASERESPAASEGIEALPAGRILVMDDDAAVCEVALGMLSRLGCQARAARDGQQMLALYGEMLAAGAPFDAVILDLTIPGGMGGAEALGELLKLDAQARVIVSSGYANAPIMADFARQGLYGVVAKPYRVEELRRVLAEVLGREA